MSQGISRRRLRKRHAQVDEPIEHGADDRGKENEQLLMVCDQLATVLRFQTAGQAVVLLGISRRRKATQKLPRPLIHSSRLIPLFSRNRRTLITKPLLGPVFDDARGHIHVGLDSGPAVFETKCVPQFPSIIPGLLFCR
jgi:hypothetical protein